MIHNKKIEEMDDICNELATHLATLGVDMLVEGCKVENPAMKSMGVKLILASGTLQQYSYIFALAVCLLSDDEGGEGA